MSKSLARSERKLLLRIQFRLMVFYMIAFLAFEGLVMGFTYLILRRTAMVQIYQSIQSEWVQKLPDAKRVLAPDHVEDNNTGVKIDKSPEQIATWMVAANGKVMVKDFGIPAAKIAEPFVENIIQQSQASRGEVWKRNDIGQTPVMIGADPVYSQGKRLGTMVSIRSVSVVRDSVNALARIEVYLGLGSILLLLPLTYLLSKNALKPIRSALIRQRNFVNDAAHELRTPLTILRGTLELAQLDTDLDAIHEAIEDSLEETDYITELIADLSTLARMESGATQLNLKQADLTQIIQETVKGLQEQAKTKSIHLLIDEASPALHAVVDERRIRQLLTILIDNAIKYTFEQGEVKISVRQSRHDIRILVQDSGIGIAAKDLPHIFDRFYRASSAATKASGSGIGLSIGAWIAQAHRGHILVESYVGKGTTFTVVLPYRPT